MVSWHWWGSSKYMRWLVLVWDDESVKVTGEFRFTVAVSADPGTKTDREGERFAAGATKVGNVVGPDITQSNITLCSLCCCILSWWLGLHPAFTGFKNVSSSVGAAALKSIFCRSLLSGVQEFHIGAYQLLYFWESPYLPPPYRASTS